VHDKNRGCGTYKGNRTVYRVLMGKKLGKDNLENLGIDGRQYKNWP
jgi:hypothetical protein